MAWAPDVKTGFASTITNTKATLSGLCQASGADVLSYVIFQWGRTTYYGNWTYYEIAIPGKEYFYRIEGLNPDTTYHFRIAGTSEGLWSYGQDSEFTTLAFAPPPPKATFMNWIIYALNGVSEWFYGIYLTIFDWIPPFCWIADTFLGLSVWFNWLAWHFHDFGEWVNSVIDRLGAILSIPQIYSYFKEFLDAAIAAGDWLKDVWASITAILEDWWASLAPIVLGWISEATDWLSERIDSVEEWLTNLQAQISYLLDQMPSLNEILSWFTNWWGNILTNLTTWWDDRLLDIQSLINSAFLDREPFWEGWLDWKDQILEFIQDPWKWLNDRVEEFFDRFW